MNYRIRFDNSAGKTLVELSPVTFKDLVADKPESYIAVDFTEDSLEFSWMKKEILNVIERILTTTSEKVVIICVAKEDSSAGWLDFFAIHLEVGDKGIMVKGLTNPKVPITTTDRDVMNFLTDNVQDNILDIYLKSTASSFSKIAEDIKESMGMHKTDFDEKDGEEELCAKISKETKAEIVKPKETLDDYVCNKLLREELSEIVDFFDNAKAYKDAGVDIPKGILFKGPWGTGKTYAARCIAGSVKCYFMTCTASSLQGMYIGSGAENIRAVFKGAKALAKASGKGVILFIDELDSFGDRQNHSGGASGEEDRTLNQLLAEMSGFESDTDILVLAATNFPERLDSALMRSGRFGRQITIDYPDEEERTAMLKYYFGKRKLPLERELTIEMISPLTKGLTPADIKEISNEAGILTIRQHKTEITLDNVNEAINKVITKNIRHPDKDTEELELVAAHECGHVLAEVIFNGTIPIKVTNYSYGDAGGFTQTAEVLSGILQKDRFINEIKMLLGGRAAEEVLHSYITNGASNDIAKAKKLLYDYYKVYNFEPYVVKELDQLVIDKLGDIYDSVCKAFKEDSNLNVLKELTKELISKRVLYSSDIAAITTPLRVKELEL